jgi:hypothetical protein
MLHDVDQRQIGRLIDRLGLERERGIVEVNREIGVRGGEMLPIEKAYRQDRYQEHCSYTLHRLRVV